MLYTSHNKADLDFLYALLNGPFDVHDLATHTYIC